VLFYRGRVVLKIRPHFCRETRDRAINFWINNNVNGRRCCERNARRVRSSWRVHLSDERTTTTIARFTLCGPIIARKEALMTNSVLRSERRFHNRYIKTPINAFFSFFFFPRIYTLHFFFPLEFVSDNKA